MYLYTIIRREKQVWFTNYGPLLQKTHQKSHKIPQAMYFWPEIGRKDLNEFFTRHLTIKKMVQSNCPHFQTKFNEIGHSFEQNRQKT